MTAAIAAAAARSAGLTDRAKLITAVAIAGAESGWNPAAVGDVALADSVWGPSLGLWQIRSLRADYGSGRARDAERLHDPEFNARAMVEISANGTNWRPWSVWTNGAYRDRIAQATAAVDALGPAVVDIPLRPAPTQGAAGLRRAALELLRSKLGVAEDGKNHNDFGKYWSLDGEPYCALAISWAFAQLGHPLPTINVAPGQRPPGMWSYVPSGSSFARAYGLTVANPEPGDIINFSFTETDQHTGFFDRWEVPGAVMRTVEANTSNADADPNQSDGIYVAARRRHVSTISCLWRPSFTALDELSLQRLRLPGFLGADDMVRAFQLPSKALVMVSSSGLWWPLVPLPEWTDFGKVEAAMEEAIAFGVLDRHTPANPARPDGIFAPITDAALALLKRVS